MCDLAQQVRVSASPHDRALEIAPDDHLSVQAAVERQTGNAVPKTVNFSSRPQLKKSQPSTAGRDLQLNGITVYRYGWPTSWWNCRSWTASPTTMTQAGRISAIIPTNLISITDGQI